MLRFAFLDFVKAISIALVVFCHYVMIPSESVAGNILMLLAWGAVPCFFMCSGYVLLHKEETLKRSLLRTGRAYAVMVAWKLLYLLFFGLFNGVNGRWTDVLRYLLGFQSLQGVGTEHFWFLYAYLATLLLLPLLRPLFLQRQSGVILWMLALVFLSNQFVSSANLMIQIVAPRLGVEAFELDGFQQVFPLGGEYSSMLFFFLLGGWLRMRDENSSPKQRALPAVLCLLTGLAVLLCVKYLQTHSWAWNDCYLVNGYGWTGTLIMSVGLFGVLRRMGETRPAQWLGSRVGRNTMGIFYLHYLVLHVLEVYVYPCLPESLLLNCMKAIAITALCALITAGAKKVPLVKRLFQ